MYDNFECLLSEAPGFLSRENVTLGADAAANEIVGKVTATGKYVPWDPTAEDGSEVVAGVNLAKAKANALVVIVDTTAEVKTGVLVYPEGFKDEAIAGLRALIIKARS